MYEKLAEVKRTFYNRYTIKLELMIDKSMRKVIRSMNMDWKKKKKKKKCMSGSRQLFKSERKKKKEKNTGRFAFQPFCYVRYETYSGECTYSFYVSLMTETCYGDVQWTL